MKRLNWGLLLAALICVVFWAGVIILCSGCGEAEFAGGLVAGAAGTLQMMDSAQNRAIEAVNAIEARTAELNAANTGMVVPTLKPETVAAIEKAKGFKDNPVAWVAIAEALALAFGAGVLKKKKN